MKATLLSLRNLINIFSWRNTTTRVVLDRNLTRRNLEWSMLDAIYYSVISLTTIGFGDLIPRNEPPENKATHVKNESACLCELINPVPSNDVNNATGLSKLCNPVNTQVIISI